MITRIVKLSIKTEHREAFRQIFLKKNSLIQQNPGCHGVKMTEDLHHPGVFFTISQWENEEALNAYRNSALFGEIWPQVKTMFFAKAEAWSTEICN
ncbi:MAG: antibiotic biosynthesis monooxygenase [Flavobacteriales bacterium]|jgi:quinol monooxygenase YgiN|nr:antibiotic biosynthesis monooxygenase [Flavobacteriales bacterium]